MFICSRDDLSFILFRLSSEDYVHLNDNIGLHFHVEEKRVRECVCERERENAIENYHLCLQIYYLYFIAYFNIACDIYATLAKKVTTNK